MILHDETFPIVFAISKDMLRLVSLLRYHYSYLLTLPALKTPKPWQRVREPIEDLGPEVLALVAKGLRTLAKNPSTKGCW